MRMQSCNVVRFDRVVLVRSS